MLARCGREQFAVRTLFYARSKIDFSKRGMGNAIALPFCCRNQVADFK